jgi:halocyanin-like protein
MYNIRKMKVTALSRRKTIFLLGAGVTLPLSGCSGDDTGSDSNGDTDTDDGESGDDGSDTTNDSTTDGDDGEPEAKPTAHEYLSSNDANDYDGEVKDETGETSISIKNGTNAPQYAFTPAAVKIDAGTEVTWEWVSDVHTVHPEYDDFEGETTIYNEGHSYSYTFEEPGTYLYYCQPHRVIGQLGAVIVE